MVFGVTATFSVFAYVWLLIILMWITPNVVDLWEAILTFVFFPILVLIAYAADKGWMHKLFCISQDSAASDKQRQIELGNFQPGESMYQFPFFLPFLEDPSAISLQSSNPCPPPPSIVVVSVFHICGSPCSSSYYYYHHSPTT